MASETNWVEEVRRWVASSRPQSGRLSESASDTASDWGYEAANPALQAAHWPDTQASVKELDS